MRKGDCCYTSNGNSFTGRKLDMSQYVYRLRSLLITSSFQVMSRNTFVSDVLNEIFQK